MCKEELIYFDGVDYEPREGESREDYEKRIEADYLAFYGRPMPTLDEMPPELKKILDNIVKSKGGKR